jgi:hypothetical protein
MYNTIFSITMIQLLLKNNKKDYEDWRKECFKLNISREVFRLNKNKFIKLGIIRINLGTISIDMENAKKIFPEYVFA